MPEQALGSVGDSTSFGRCEAGRVRTQRNCRRSGTVLSCNQMSLLEATL